MTGAILLVVVLAAALVLAYRAACYVIGQVAGAFARRARPVTEFELRRAAIDERAARDATRPWAEPIEVLPMNGSDTTP
jgi:hypothetical protein